ncbi:MAG: hypothetical protein CR986_04425 [Ignavibacteriae bacterium]|nr:MAG: hypothetical protein CR986_04425 [Ignavibacteriota bacterium]
MPIKKVKQKFLRVAGNNFAFKIINLLCKTLKYQEYNSGHLKKLKKANKNAIFAFWHGKMLAGWFLLKEYKPSTIVSQSKDGEILSNILLKWNYKVKRGSSSKNGKKILNELISEVKNNANIAITPDGPKGPKEEMKAGTVILAKKTETPIILMGIKYNKKIQLKSWDSFEIPIFFSKVNIYYSEPIYVNSELNYDETNSTIKNINNELIKIQNKVNSI